MKRSLRPRLPAVAMAATLLACADDPTGPGAADRACAGVDADQLELPAPSALLDARRRALATQIGAGVVVLAAGAGNPDPANQGYRGDSNLFYLAGVDLPGSWLVLVARESRLDSALLYLPAAHTSATAARQVPDVTGIERVRCTDRFATELARLLPPGGPPLYTHPDNGAASDPLVQALGQRPAIEARPLTAQLAALRLVKDTAEIARLRRAADITARSIADAVQVIRPGGSEAEVAAAVLAGFAARGAPRASFPSIVASGGNALTLHYQANERAFSGGELVLIDVGAEFGRYAGDVTRTFPVAGRFSQRQRALYQLVLGSRLAALAEVRPGITLNELDATARDHLRTNSGQLCGQRTCDQYFPHLLSHTLGLNVHDVGGWNLRLAPGMVITIEPGLYLPADSIGIRIEDTVLVTETGAEVLSGAVPSSIDLIEAMFAARPGESAARASSPTAGPRAGPADRPGPDR